MDSVKEHLDNILNEVHLLNHCTTEPDEFVAVHEIELAVHNATKVFERTKNIGEKD